MATLDLWNDSVTPDNYVPNVCDYPGPILSIDVLATVAVACGNPDQLFLYSESSGAPLGIVALNSLPSSLAFDNRSNMLYVSENSGVEAVNLSSFTVIDSIALSGYPGGVSYDYLDDRILVTVYASSLLLSLSPSLASVEGNLSLEIGSYPLGIAFDPVDRDVFVADSAIGRVGVYNASTFAFVENLSIPGDPIVVSCDSSTGTVYVGAQTGFTVTAISSALSVLTTTNLPTGPTSIAVDPSRNLVIVTDNNVTILNGSTLSNVGIVPNVSAEDEVTVDAAQGMLFLDNSQSASVIKVAESNLTVVAQLSINPSPYWIDWDNSNSEFYLTERTNGTIASIYSRGYDVNHTVNLMSAPGGLSVSSPAGRIFVTLPQANGLDELAEGGTILTTAKILDGPSQVAIDPVHSIAYVTSQNSNTVTLVSEQDDSVVGVVNLTSLSFEEPLGLAFDEKDATMFVALHGCACGGDHGFVAGVNTITHQVVQTLDYWGGPGPVSIAFDSLNGDLYVTDSINNLVWVLNPQSGGNLARIAVGAAPSDVVFDPLSGNLLVSNAASHTLSVIDGQTNQVIQTVAVGANPQGIAIDTRDGVIAVADEGSGTVSFLTFAPTYSLKFVEEGLPDNTSWSVSVNGSLSQNRTANSLGENAFQLPNGTYSYRINVVPGFEQQSIASVGLFTISGSNVTQVLHFLPVTYSVTFEESGLPLGEAWSVSVGGISQDSATSEVVVDLPNGSYRFAIVAPASFQAIPESGRFNVSGSEFEISISMTLETSTGPQGVSQGDRQALFIVGVSAAVASIAVVIWWTRKQGGKCI